MCARRIPRREPEFRGVVATTWQQNVTSDQDRVRHQPVGFVVLFDGKPRPNATAISISGGIIDGGMVRPRRAWLLALAVFVDAPAGAMPAPRAEWEVIHERNQSRVKDALARVSTELASRGDFKIIQVKFRYSLHEEFSPVLASNRVGFYCKQWWHVEDALRPLGLEPIPDKNSDWFWSKRELDLVEDFALGDPKALFPAGFLAAWQRAGWGQRPVEGALQSMLPPDVDVTPDGCLRLNGSQPLSDALRAWLAGRWARP